MKSTMVDFQSVMDRLADDEISTSQKMHIYPYQADPSQDGYWQKVTMKAHQILDAELLHRYQLCEKRCCPKPVVFMKLMCKNCSLIAPEELDKAIEKHERAEKRRIRVGIIPDGIAMTQLSHTYDIAIT